MPARAEGKNMVDENIQHNRTEDGRYIVVNGRKWRATDPSIPDQLESQLVKELMNARRLVKTEGDAVRYRVHDAKVALGERGEPWWEPTLEGRKRRLEATIRALLRSRDGTTICPSEAARVVGGDNWRDLMDLSREVAGELATAGVVVITQKGKEIDLDSVSGPVRLAPGANLYE